MARKKFNLGGRRPKEADWKAQLSAPTKEVNVSEIITDPKLQHRATMNRAAIADYAQVMEDGGELAPVKLMQTPDGKKYLYDGYHTLEAALASGRQTLKATIKRGTWREAWLESLGVNHDHGVRRSIGDKRKAVDDALSDPEIRDSIIAEDGKWSFRKIAKYTKTTHPFVSKRWERMYPPEPTPDELETSHQTDRQSPEQPTSGGSNVTPQPLAASNASVATQTPVGGERDVPTEGGNVTTVAQAEGERVASTESGNVTHQPLASEAASVATRTPVGGERTVPPEGGNVTTVAQAEGERAAPPESGNVTTNSQINEIISLATGAGADVIDLNDAEFAKVIYHLSDGKEYNVTMNKPDETIIILRFPHSV